VKLVAAGGVPLGCAQAHPAARVRAPGSPHATTRTTNLTPDTYLAVDVPCVPGGVAAAAAGGEESEGAASAG
jgi:hypothetical protein